MTTIELAAGQVISSPQFSEPMRVETVQSNGAGIRVAGLVGIRPEQRMGRIHRYGQLRTR